MKELLRGLAFVLVLAGALWLGITCENAMDNKAWNNGCCDDCGGAWKFTSAETYRTSKYWYQCEECGNVMHLTNPR